MTRQNRFRVVRVVILSVAVIATGTMPMNALEDQGAAAAAAKASPDLISQLSKEIGGTPEQAAGAAGSLFGLAKSRLSADDFSKIAKVVPGMDMLLKAAPASSAAAGGAADPLSKAAGSVAGIPAVANAFSKLGLKPEMVPKAASALTAFVTKSGGASLGGLLAGVLK